MAHLASLPGLLDLAVIERNVKAASLKMRAQANSKRAGVEEVSMSYSRLGLTAPRLQTQIHL
jgi:hypothetical protein